MPVQPAIFFCYNSAGLQVPVSRAGGLDPFPDVEETTALNKVKRICEILMGSAIFWIFVILGFMVVFIIRYERPVNFTVQQQYKIF